MASTRWTSCVVFASMLPIASALGLWSSTPANYSDVIRQAYPVGNGKLAAMPFGSPGLEKLSLNVDSLWSGGPFQSDNYTGGNPVDEKYQYLPGIRSWIFANGTGNVTQLLGNGDNYGSYQVLGNLSVSLDGVSASTAYNRSLDLDTGLHTTRYTANDGNNYITTIYCSFPDQVCVYHLESSFFFPTVSISMENQLVNSALQNMTCGNDFARLTGVTQLGPPVGMKYDAIARLVNPSNTSYCSNTSTGALVIPRESRIRALTLVIGAGTDYDQTRGSVATNFTFRGPDPSSHVEETTRDAARKPEAELRQSHMQDFSGFSSSFTLELPDIAGSAGLETSSIIDRYESNSNTTGDPYLESLLFAYGRYLFISSSRANSLPPNLQGKWSYQLEGAWSADYHLDINLQMNHWGVDQTGLGDLQSALWDFMQDTWVPRGTLTAQLLYGADGWVTHDEMNIFGHTGMKNEAYWANYPASAAWMVQHIWDHYEYSRNTTWFITQGYPPIKGVAQFWLSQLQPDTYFNESTLVVNPCNSPEHGPTTFACTHYQQLLYQVFSAVLSGSLVAGETDKAFVSSVTKTVSSLDTGLHIGTWGEIKEWKLPDSLNYDVQNDTHRHLSQLVGWYPGYSISSFAAGYSNATIQHAVATSLYSRGPGEADANAGWEKVWRAACWARLNNTEKAYFELRFAISENFAHNGLSMYSGTSEPFQIDANFGLVGAALSMLVVDLPQKDGDERMKWVVLGPAIPKQWGGGRVKGLRLRGGWMVDFAWNGEGLVIETNLTGTSGRTESILVLNKEGQVQCHGKSLDTAPDQ